MPIVHLTTRIRELGRIRMGDQIETKNKDGKTVSRPNRLDKFRLTTQDRQLLEAAAELYGGTVRPWEEQPGQFELYVQAEELPCIVSPQEVSQWYEMWSGGGCQRRCDGVQETLSGSDCKCDPDKRECKTTTRLSVMLHQLPGLGVWRLETHGWYAATEIPAAAALLLSFKQQGINGEAFLAIEERTVIREGKTKKVPVPVIRIRKALATLMSGEVITPSKQIEAPRQALPAPATQATRPQQPNRTQPARTQQPESSGDRKANARPKPATNVKLCPSCNAPEGKPHGPKCKAEHPAPAAEPKDPREVASARLFAVYAKVCTEVGVDPADAEWMRWYLGAMLSAGGEPVVVTSRKDLTTEQLQACTAYLEGHGLPPVPEEAE